MLRRSVVHHDDSWVHVWRVHVDLRVLKEIYLLWRLLLMLLVLLVLVLTDGNFVVVVVVRNLLMLVRLGMYKCFALLELNKMRLWRFDNWDRSLLGNDNLFDDDFLHLFGFFDGSLNLDWSFLFLGALFSVATAILSVRLLLPLSVFATRRLFLLLVRSCSLEVTAGLNRIEKTLQILEIGSLSNFLVGLALQEVDKVIGGGRQQLLILLVRQLS